MPFPDEWITSSSLRPGTFIGYNFGKDDGAESKFGTHKELIVLNIIKYNYCVNKSGDMSRDHFCHVTIIDQLVARLKK